MILIYPKVSVNDCIISLALYPSFFFLPLSPLSLCLSPLPLSPLYLCLSPPLPLSLSPPSCLNPSALILYQLPCAVPVSRPVFKCPLLAAGVLGTVFDILSQEVDVRLKVRSSVHCYFQLMNVRLSAESHQV